MNSWKELNQLAVLSGTPFLGYIWRGDASRPASELDGLCKTKSRLDGWVTVAEFSELGSAFPVVPMTWRGSLCHAQPSPVVPHWQALNGQ